MLINLENVRELEEESAGLVLLEPEPAREDIEARNRDVLVVLGEDQVLEFEDLARFLLDFHVVVVPMVADPQQVFRDGGGLRKVSGEDGAVEGERYRIGGLARV